MKVYQKPFAPIAPISPEKEIFQHLNWADKRFNYNQTYSLKEVLNDLDINLEGKYKDINITFSNIEDDCIQILLESTEFIENPNYEEQYAIYLKNFETYDTEYKKYQAELKAIKIKQAEDQLELAKKNLERAQCGY